MSGSGSSGASTSIPATAAPARRTLGLGAVAAIAFFNVSGGPAGSEELFSGGPAIGLALILGMVVVWCIPTVLLTSELSSAFPHNGGYSLWVKAAFGSFWGMQESYWSWSSGVIDNAGYPILIFEAACALWPSLHGDAIREYCIKAGLAICFSVPLFFSTELTGHSLLLVAALVLAPFAVFVILRLPAMDFEVLGEIGEPVAVDWKNMACIAFWNLSGFDCVSTVAGEIKNPRRTIPRGLLLCMIVAVVQYVLVLCVAAAASPIHWSEWKSGHIAKIMRASCGDWLGVWTMAVLIMSNAGQYVAELLEDSFQLCGMGRQGLAPRIFAWRHARFDTPWVAIAFQLAIVLGLVACNFKMIVAVVAFLNVLSTLLEISALCALCYTQPELHRPFRIPLGNGALVAAFMPTTAVGIFIAYAGLFESEQSLVVNLVALALGVPLGLAALRSPTGVRWGAFCAGGPLEEEEEEEEKSVSSSQKPLRPEPAGGAPRVEDAEPAAALGDAAAAGPPRAAVADAAKGVS